MTGSRSFLIVTIEGGGNIPVVMGVVRRLLGAGHRVDVLTEPCLRSVVEESGAGFFPFTEYFTREDRRVDIFGDSEGRNPIDGMKRSLTNVILGPAGLLADQTFRRLEEGDYDVLVADVLMPGALIAGEAAGTATAILHHMTEYLPGPGRPPPGFRPRTDWIGRLRDGLFERAFLRVFGGYLDQFNSVRTRFGLPPVSGIPEQLHRADRRLIMTSEAFDFPLKPAPRNLRYAGPILDDPDWATSDWDNPWPEPDQRPLVVVGLSSTFQNQADALQRTITALGTLDVRGLVTLGPAMDQEEFVIPPNVVAVPQVSHAAVFPHATALVTHAGLGTLTRGLCNNLPVVCLPMGRDQDSNAARVVFHGAGLRLKPSASSQKIARAIKTVLAEPSYRTSAEKMGDVLQRAADQGTVVRELEGLARGEIPVASYQLPEQNLEAATRHP